MSEGAARWVWPREGEPVASVAAWEGDSLLLAVPAAPGGSYVLELSIAFERGAVEYGVQLDLPAAPGAAPRTGIEGVDAVIDAVLSKDAEALAALTAMMEIASVAPPAEGLGGPPLCEEGERAGDIVRVLPIAYCEGTYGRDPLVVARLFVDPATGLHSVVEGPAEDRPADLWPIGEYYVNFYARTQLGEHGVQLWVTGGRVVLVFFGCAHPIESLVTYRGAPLPLVLGPLPAPDAD